MPSYSLREPAVLAFIVIPVVLLALLGAGVVRAWRLAGATAPSARAAAAGSVIAGAAWMALTWAVAASGVLRAWDRMPPPLALLVFAVFAVAAAMSLGPVGARLAMLPLWMLVAVQAFRLPLELAMHAMYERGIMPEPMSYSGRNFDILTGGTAIVVAALVAARLAGPRLVLAWNLLGSALLVNVLVVAILATPLFRYFGDEHLNTWVTYPPFVWLPAVMVVAALAGHVLIFRALGKRA